MPEKELLLEAIRLLESPEPVIARALVLLKRARHLMPGKTTKMRQLLVEEGRCPDCKTVKEGKDLEFYRCRRCRQIHVLKHLKRRSEARAALCA